MNSNKKTLVGICLLLICNLASLIVSGQNTQTCKNNYNKALSYYNRGQYEGIDEQLTDCIAYINDKKDYYRSNSQAIITVFKVYKIIINSYKNLDREKLAEIKFNELVTFFSGELSRDEVEKRLNDTLLTPID